MKFTIEKSEKNLLTIHEWIKMADQKASVFLALEGIILTLLIPNYLKTITSRFQTHTISIWNGALVLLATISLGYSVFEGLNVIFPRLNNEAKSHLYFGGIKNMSLIQYRRDMKNLTNENYFNELSEQVHTNSLIAFDKYKRFQRAIVFFLIGIGLFIASYVSFKSF